MAARTGAAAAASRSATAALFDSAAISSIVLADADCASVAAKRPATAARRPVADMVTAVRDGTRAETPALSADVSARMTHRRRKRNIVEGRRRTIGDVVELKHGDLANGLTPNLRRSQGTRL